MPSSRREFLVLGSLAGASLLLSCGSDRETAAPAGRDPAGAGPEPGANRLNFWLAILPDGAVELRLTKLEMGQGIWTALAVVAAEELELEPSALRLVVPSTDDVRSAPSSERIERKEKLLDTGSSVSLRRSWQPVRTAAAAAREMLVAAAAAAWGVAISECRAENGRVVHAASGRSAGFGELAAAAAKLPLPRQPKLKSPGEFRFVGKPRVRLEAPEIVTGRARFSCDVRLPGQRFAVVARPPSIGAKALTVDDAAARATPGVLGVVAIGELGVAVVGETTWAALQGRDRLKIEWDAGTASDLSSASFARTLDAALDAPLLSDGAEDEPRTNAGTAVVVDRRGEPIPWDSPGAQRAEYATAFQAHVPMEPPNALARVAANGHCEIWCGTQYPHRTQTRVARRLGLKPAQVVVRPQRMGGSFGRKEADDFVFEAVEVARTMPGVPVQLFWSRSDDLRHDFVHTATRHRMAARLSGRKIAAWRHRVASPSPEKQWKILQRTELIPKAESSGAWNPPYDFASFQVEYADPACPIALGFWRGVEVVSNVFAVESFVDELAHAAGRDPIEFRLAQLGKEQASAREATPFALARLAACYERAAALAGWSTTLPKGRGRGVAGLVFGGMTACATIAEVTVADGSYTVDRVVCAIDCGIVVNPKGLEGNAESAVAWGLSALGAELTYEKGAVVEASHIDYPIPRLPQMPAVEVVTIPSEEPPTGSGEIPVPTIAPAVANAIFAASGRRLRRLPFRPEDFA